jgi:hypothetical protein
VSKITRKVLRKSNDGESFVSVIESVRPNDSIVSIERDNADNFDTQSLMSISTIDSELRDRLDRLKINIRNQNDENERPQTAIKKVSNLTKSSFFNLKIRHQKCDLMKITSILQFIRDHRQHQPVQEMIDIGMGKGDLMLQRS